MLQVDPIGHEQGVSVRRELGPGDLGEIARLHGRLYAAEHALGPRFEAGVARTLAAAVESGWPERGGVWIVERDGHHAGSIAWTDEDDGARVRFVLLDPRVRGRGLARRLMGEVLADSAARGLVYLTTFSELTEAGALYRSLGFVVTESKPFGEWEREIVLQRYELRR